MDSWNRISEKLHKDIESRTAYQFIESIIQSHQDSEKLILELGDIRPRHEKEYSNLTYFNRPDWMDDIDPDKKFDFIYGELPFGMNRESLSLNGKEIKLRRNWINLFNAANFLNSDGIGIFTAEPTLFSMHDGEAFEDLLNDNSLYVSAIFNGIDHPITGMSSITPVFVILKRSKPESVFVASLTSKEQGNDVFLNYQNAIDGQNLQDGFFIENKTFKGFQNIIIKQQINGLETQFKGYAETQLGKIALEINTASTGKEHVEKDNSIFIPKVGNSAVKTSIQDLSIKHHNYIQVVLKEDVDNTYVAAFYRSQIGKLILQELATGTTIPNITKKSLITAVVVLPPVEEQKIIVNTQKKLNLLKDNIKSFEDELALNPIGSTAILHNLDDMLNVIGGLTEVDRIRSQIREGESKYLEFKETMSLNVRTQSRDDKMIVSALKTIVAFLNADGGTLLIGVHDNGEILGIEKEIEKLHKGINDKYLLHCKDLIKSRIGREFFEYIDYSTLDMGDHTILKFACKRSEIPCFLDKKVFYVRTNPASEIYEGPQLAQYLSTHFRK
jgi:hypothetical protein